MSTTLLSSDLCIKKAFNEEVNALEVKVKDTSISLSLNHQEDSVTTVAKCVSKQIKKDEINKNCPCNKSTQHMDKSNNISIYIIKTKNSINQ